MLAGVSSGSGRNDTARLLPLSQLNPLGFWCRKTLICMSRLLSRTDYSSKGTVIIVKHVPWLSYQRLVRASPPALS